MFSNTRVNGFLRVLQQVSPSQKNLSFLSFQETGVTQPPQYGRRVTGCSGESCICRGLETARRQTPPASVKDRTFKEALPFALHLYGEICGEGRSHALMTYYVQAL